MSTAAIGRIGRRYALAHDGCYRAFVDEATAFAKHDAHDERVRAAERAYAFFARVGFRWRAAHVVGLLACWSTKADRWKQLEEFTSAPQVLPVRQALESARLAALPPRARDIVAEIRRRRSLDLEEIAKAVGLTVHGVRYHLPRIYHRFGVRSCLELLRVLGDVA